MAGKKLYVGNLPYTATEENVRSFFEGCGEITAVQICADKETGRAKGFGFVEFIDDASAEKGLERNGDYLQGESGDPRAVNIDIAKPKEKRAFAGASARPEHQYN